MDSAYLLIMMFALLFAAGSMLVFNLVPDFEKLNLNRKFVDELGAGRKPPGLFNAFRIPILVFEDFSSQIKSPAMRQRYSQNLKDMGIEQMVTVNQVLALKVTLTVIMCIYAILLIGVFPILVLILPPFGWFFIDIWFKDQITARKLKIKLELPFLLDTMTLAVEAGLEFTASMSRIVERMRPTPLRDELTIFLRQMQLGTSRRDGLKNLSERVNIREVGSMVSALIQASEMGSSVGSALRTQSEIMSAERFQNAEKKGAEAATKMLIPMMIFIVPAIMLIILGPLLVQYIYGGF